MTVLRDRIKYAIEHRSVRPFRYNGATATNISSCPRLIWHQVNNPSKLRHPDYYLSLKFNEGNEQEDIMTNIIESNISGAMVAERNVKTLEGYIGRHRVRCRPDGLLYDPDNDKNLMPVIEFKSMDESNFLRFMNRGIKESHPYYYDQLQVTMHVSRSHFNRVSIPYGILFAKLRGSEVDVWDEEVEYDRGYIDTLEEILDERDLMLGSSEPPERPTASNSTNCLNCSGFNACWSPDNVQVGKKKVDWEDSIVKLLKSLGNEWLSIDDQEGDLKARKQDIRRVLEALMQDENLDELPIDLDTIDATITPHYRRFERSTVDKELLGMEFPSVLQAVMKTTPVKQFRFKVVRDGRTTKT